MKYVTIIALLSILLMPFAFAINVNIEPTHPKKGEIVKVYATGINESHDVRLEYCVGNTFCSMPTPMHYENGKWIGNFTMPNAKSVEVNILVDGETIWNETITTQEKSTPSFEIFVIISAFIAAMLIWKRKI